MEYDKEPIIVREAFINESRPWLNNELERSHNISILFRCKLPEGYSIDNKGLQEHESGYLKWLDSVPTDLLKAHVELYGDILENWFNRDKQ